MRFTQDNARVNNDLGGAMTDISFLLIVFFLVTAVFVSEEGLFTNLPEDNTSPKEESIKNVLQLYFSSANTNEEGKNTILKVNGKTFSNQEEALTYIRELSIKNSSLVAFLVVGSDIDYQAVVTLISDIKSMGVSDFTVLSGTEADFDSKLIPLSIPNVELDIIEDAALPISTTDNNSEGGL